MRAVTVDVAALPVFAAKESQEYGASFAIADDQLLNKPFYKADGLVVRCRFLRKAEISCPKAHLNLVGAIGSLFLSCHESIMDRYLTCSNGPQVPFRGTKDLIIDSCLKPIAP